MNKDRILLVVNSGCGGAERMTVLYAKILQENGFNCKLLVINCSGSEENRLQSFIPPSLPHHVIRCRFRHVPFLLLKEIHNFIPTVIFSSIVPTNNLLLSFKLLGLVKSRVIIRMNTIASRIKDESKLHFHLSKTLFRKADEIISQTNEMKVDMCKVFKLPEESITTIYNPIDKDLIEKGVQEATPYDSEYINYVAVGRLNPVKDYETLIRAFSIVHGVKNNTRIHIVGDTNDKTYVDTLEKLAESLSIKEAVSFEGFQQNPYKYIYNANAFILSSTIEGLPNVLLESLYLGVPVVCTRCVPFVEQVVKEGVNGFTVDVRDVNKMAEKMLEVLSIEKDRGTMDSIDSEMQIINLFKHAK